MDIYVSSKQSNKLKDLNEFSQSEIEVKSQTRFTFRSSSLLWAKDGFTLGMKVNGANLYLNKYFESKVTV